MITLLAVNILLSVEEEKIPLPQITPRLLAATKLMQTNSVNMLLEAVLKEALDLEKLNSQNSLSLIQPQ